MMTFQRQGPICLTPANSALAAGHWSPELPTVMIPFGKGCLYERLQSGELDRMRQRLYNQYKDPAPAERMMRFIKG